MNTNDLQKHLDFINRYSVSGDKARKILKLPLNKTFRSRLYNTENVRVFIVNNRLVLISKDIA